MKEKTYVSTETETDIWIQYKNGLSFQQSMGFSYKFPEYERFKCGDQWPPVTERTKALPRPVFNIISMFVSNKKSSVLNNNMKMVFSSAETGDNTDEYEMPEIREKAVKGAEQYTSYAQNLWFELGQDSLNDSCVEDAATNGTGILHYYWDYSVKGGKITPYSGALRGETIDALNFFVSNPHEADVQKQDWVIISSRMSVNAAKEIAKANGAAENVIELIRPDEDTADEGYDTARLEQQGSKNITMLTKYYRKNGSVYYSRSTKNVVLVKDKCLTPISNVFTDNEIESETTVEPEYITLYPIAVFNWQKRKKCIFGHGEVEGIIPNQKAINFNIGMMLLSVQDTGWPKMLVKPGALRQPVTNLPGEIITDYYTSGDGVKYMQPPNFSYIAINLTDKIMDLSRSTSGVTEVTTGEQLGANMAASAIIALQNQAKLPIDNIQKRFYRTIKNVGRIWEQFFKTYYSMERSVVKKDVGDRPEAYLFRGTDYADVDFDLIIDVGASSTYSEALGQATLDKMYDKGDIDVDAYIELSPPNVMPFKESLRQIRQRQPQEVAAQVNSQNIQKSLMEGGDNFAVPDLQDGGGYQQQ